jgi:hypothetical protein
MTPSIIINNLTSRRVGQILFQGKVALGLIDRLYLVWNGFGMDSIRFSRVLGLRFFSFPDSLP